MSFIVMTLIAGRPTTAASDGRGVRGVRDATVVHLRLALVASAVMSAPWRSASSASIALLAFGVGGGAGAIASPIKVTTHWSVSPLIVLSVTCRPRQRIATRSLHDTISHDFELTEQQRQGCLQLYVHGNATTT